MLFFKLNLVDLFKYLIKISKRKIKSSYKFLKRLHLRIILFDTLRITEPYFIGYYAFQLPFPTRRTNTLQIFEQEPL
jgi:hypothetical protein